jgi:hypothetical protein
VIYVLHNPTRNTLKIGYASSLSGAYKRWKSNQVGNCDKLECIACVDGTRADDARIRRLFKKINKRGDWFYDDGKIREWLSTQHDFLAPQREKLAKKKADLEARKRTRAQQRESSAERREQDKVAKKLERRKQRLLEVVARLEREREERKRLEAECLICGAKFVAYDGELACGPDCQGKIDAAIELAKLQSELGQRQPNLLIGTDRHGFSGQIGQSY